MNAKIDSIDAPSGGSDSTQELRQQTDEIGRHKRELAQGHLGAVVWFTGLPASGKSTIADALQGELRCFGVRTYRLDGDSLRIGLCSDLGFTAVDRTENVRRAAEVAALFAGTGVVTLASFISPYADGRSRARAAARDVPFLEVFVDCPLDECERRDPKHLYRQARAGRIIEFTGISAPYEVPVAPDLHIRSDGTTVSDAVAGIVCALRARGVLR
jgi:adenylylsulfate kinase